MTPVRFIRLALCAAVFGAFSATASSATASSATESAVALRLSLSWAPESGGVATAKSVLTIVNADSRAFPAQGWSIYFNCDAGIKSGSIVGASAGRSAEAVAVDSLGGTFYKLHPEAGFRAIASGQELQVPLAHFDDLINVSQAPMGPYLVLDEAPGLAWNLTDYRVLMGQALVVSPKELYQRNASIADMAESALPPVLPTPRHYTRQKGELRWLARPRVIGSEALQPEVRLANRLLDRYFSDRTGDPSVPPLRLAVAKDSREPSSGHESPEAYLLRVDPVVGVVVTGQSAAGVSRGLQTLHGLLPLLAREGTWPQGKLVEIPGTSIIDGPRFKYRGLQIDVARNFQRKEVLFKILDLMANYKLNTLHLHLTDDEGWRLEIAGIPELTQVGARRGHDADSAALLQPAYGSGGDPSDPHGSGYYRRADFIDVLRYAAALRIEVIPEFEMPGHARAAVKAMARRYQQLHAVGRADADEFQLQDTADQSQYSSAQYYTDNLMDPGVSGTYTFIDHVLSDVVAMYREAGVSLNTLHVGGDELPAGAWARSPASLALMKRLKVTSTVLLWDYFYDRVDQLVRKHGLITSGWEELGSRRERLTGESPLVPNPRFAQRGFRVYAWNDSPGTDDLGFRLANAGYSTVLAPASRLYFDMMVNRDPQEPGARWQPAIDLDAVYDYAPIRDGLSQAGRKNILGLEGEVFTETMRDPERIEYMLMPRMLALAERAWAHEPAWIGEPDRTKARRLRDAGWSAFVNQLGKQVLPRLDAEGSVGYRIPPPGLMVVDAEVRVNMQLPGFALRYTVNGGEPTSTSPEVTGPIAAHGVIQVAAFDRNGRMGRVSRVINR